jgi:hypothetical protein
LRAGIDLVGGIRPPLTREIPELFIEGVGDDECLAWPVDAVSNTRLGGVLAVARNFDGHDGPS